MKELIPRVMESESDTFIRISTGKRGERKKVSLQSKVIGVSDRVLVIIGELFINDLLIYSLYDCNYLSTSYIL